MFLFRLFNLKTGETNEDFKTVFILTEKKIENTTQKYLQEILRYVDPSWFSETFVPHRIEAIEIGANFTLLEDSDLEEIEKNL